MDTTTELLLTLIRGILTDTTPSLNSPPDIEALSDLYTVAKRHEMAHLAAEGLLRAGMLPPGELGGKFRKQRFAAIYSDETKLQAQVRVQSTLSRAAIPHIPLKGSYLRTLYPATWMRTRCDLDVLIHPEQLDAACQALTEDGYTVGLHGLHDVQLLSPGGVVHVELHFCLFSEEDRLDLTRLDDPWLHATPIEPNAYTYVLDDPMFYLYHIAHIAKHIRSSGCGLRPFLDLWLLDRMASVDHSARESLLRTAGLLTFAHIASEMAADLFGGIPATHPACRELEAFVLSGGIYGSQQAEAANWEQSPGKTLISKIFWPYSRLSARYPTLRKHPWLCPAYHVVRWWELLTTGNARKKLKRWRKQSQSYREDHNELRCLLDQLEL